MMSYLAKPGVIPILLPDVSDEILFPILQQLDGLILQGGVDLAPQTYKETPIGKWKGDAYRDNYELNILDRVIKQEKPVLGICRGCQLMNVYFGGTLHQDTLTQKPDALTHRDADKYDTIFHDIQFSSGKILDKIYPQISSPKVNSVHHQSIKDLGNDLEVLARSPQDNIVEAIGYTKAPEGKVMGVQWHPEFSKSLHDVVIDSDLLYQQFLDQCRR